MVELSIDFETYSELDLGDVGLYVYAQHRSTDIWMMAWAFTGEEPVLWSPPLSIEDGRENYAEIPQRVIEHIKSGGIVRAWNAQFERIIWREIMVKRYGAPKIRNDQYVCTMVEAAAMALPLALDLAAKVLNVGQEKDAEGHRLMLQMTKPRKPRKGQDPSVVYWWNEPEKIKRLGEYCLQDVRTEMAIVPVLQRLRPRERELYLLDQRINDRGFLVDRKLVLAAQAMVDEGTDRANAEIATLTAGAVTEVTKSKQLKTWLGTRGVMTDSVAKASVRELLERDDLSDDIIDVLEIRADTGRTSVAKLKPMLLSADPIDGRIRGTKQFHGAATGRWAGRGVQPDNLARGEIEAPEQFIPLVLERDYDALDLFHHPIVIVLSMMRGMIVPAPNHDLIVADFSAIEARVLNWLAGQEDVLENFRKYDAGDKSYDPYVRNAMVLYGLPFEEILKFPHRQTGKFQELGCGFQMGWRKAVSAAKATYGLTLSDEEALKAITIYRSTHAEVKKYWKAVERGAVNAVDNPGRVFPVGPEGRVKYVKAGAYLYCVLPSGRALSYAAPRIVRTDVPWCDICGKPAEHENHENGHEYEPATKEAVKVYGNITTGTGRRLWGSFVLYGGLQTENIVQAVARDLLAEAMFRAEAAQYPITMHVHDEIVAEIAKDFGSVKEFESLLAATPEWAAGCPVAAEGFRAQRYKKG